MNNDKIILGCYVSCPPVMYDATEEQKLNAKKKGDLFLSYIWGGKGIDNILKKLNNDDYGKDLELVLFEFYVNPMQITKEALKKRKLYRKKEKSIGIPIIITEENFFSKSDKERYIFLKQTILEKLDLLTEVVKNKKLDTQIDLLKSDLQKLLNEKIN